jgi:hypothetical protein
VVFCGGAWILHRRPRRHGNGCHVVPDGVAWQDVSRAPAGSNNLFPAIVARADGELRIAWMDDRRVFDPGADDPSARWNTYYRTSVNGDSTWSSETQLTAFSSDYSYSFADGFLEPYGDFMGLDVDGDGKTHAIWARARATTAPGNVWYAGQ